MSPSWKNSLLVLLGVALVVCVSVRWTPAPTAYGKAAEQGAASGSRYSVLDSEGHNLIVTDNQTNTLYFYTIDKEKEVGSELKLRGSIDLTQVGQPTIKPKDAR